jgi:membrane protease YdiL (CAAX protease family)
MERPVNPAQPLIRAPSWQVRGHSRLVLLVYAAVGLAGVAIALWDGRGADRLWQYPGGGPLTWTGRVGAATAGVVVGLAMVGLSRIFAARFAWGRWLAQEFRQRLGLLGPRDCLILAGASSLAEELLFRGALVPLLGVIGSSVIFALFHIGPRSRYLPWTVSAFLGALALGQLFTVTGQLTAPVLAHFTLNYLNLRHLSRPPASGPLGAAAWLGGKRP